MVTGRRITSIIRSLSNGKSLQHEFSRVLREDLLVPILMHGSDTTVWKEKGRYRNRDVQMDNFRSLLVIR